MSQIPKPASRLRPPGQVAGRAPAPVKRPAAGAAARPAPAKPNPKPNTTTRARPPAKRKAADTSPPPAATRDDAKENAPGGARTPKRKKRAAWDTKGRLEDMEELTTYLRDRLGSTNEQMDSLLAALSANQVELTHRTDTNRELDAALRDERDETRRLRQRAESAEDALKDAQRQHERASRDAADDQARLESKHAEAMDAARRRAAQLETERDLAQSEAAALRATIQTMSATSLQLEADARGLRAAVAARDERVAALERNLAAAQAAHASSEAQAADLDARLVAGDKQRRQLHNTIQELKGNIRVFCRVRPLLPSELGPLGDAEIRHLALGGADDGQIVIRQSTPSATGGAVTEKTYPFQFDRVFVPAATQDAVFDEISQLVQSALDGYNVCIFAYGHTGSGKTYTMEGSEKSDEAAAAGMIPRAVAQVFAAAGGAASERGWQFEFQAQMLEIYNEAIRDLLSPVVGDGAPAKKHEIRHVGDRTVVSDLTVVPISRADEVHALLRRARAARAQAATLCNERSSRSHSVFTLWLSGRNSATGETLAGSLNLIDLAGSERLQASGSTGDRLRETQAINKSLSCLGDTINALANKDAHVPFRNSKLTFLLQNALGGNSKTLMFVNVSPLAANWNETLNSLRFATKVNACQIGTASRRVGFSG